MVGLERAIHIHLEQCHSLWTQKMKTQETTPWYVFCRLAEVHDCLQVSDNTGTVWM